jgi:hypothetical protein
MELFMLNNSIFDLTAKKFTGNNITAIKNTGNFSNTTA